MDNSGHIMHQNDEIRLTAVYHGRIVELGSVARYPVNSSFHLMNDRRIGRDKYKPEMLYLSYDTSYYSFKRQGVAHGSLILNGNRPEKRISIAEIVIISSV
jgi:hypothetical protein